jgi:methyl-accepting chemotaxis protein
VEVLTKLFWADDPQTQGWIAFILVVGAIGLFWLYLPLLRRVQKSARLSRRLAKVIRSSPASLPSDFETILGSSFLADPWKRFRVQWNDSRLESGANRAPVSWRDIFDDHPLLGTGSRHAMLAAIPGIFLALGILGTFVGLTLAIQGMSFSAEPTTGPTPQATETYSTGAAGASSPSDPLAGQAKQISRLIDYMGLAFRTSLWGMVLSMFSALSIRWLEGRAEWFEVHLSDQAEHAYPYVAPAEIASRNLRGQREAFDLLRDELTTLRTDLGQALERNLEEIRTSAMGAAQEATQHQRDQMQQLFGEINDAMRAGISEHLAELQSAIANTGANQRELAGHLEAAFSGFRDLISSHETLAGRLDVASAGVESASAQLARTATDFAPAVEHLHAAGRSLESTAATIERTQQAASEAVTAVGQALVTAKENLENQGALVERSLGEIRSSIEGLSRGLADDLVRALGQFDELLGTAVNRMSGTIHESNETFERLSTPLDHLMGGTTQLRTALDEIGQNLAQLPPSLAPFSVATSELTIVNRELRDMFERLYKQMEATDRSVSQLRSTFGDRGESLERVARELLDRMREIGNRLEPRAPLRPLVEEARIVRTPEPMPPSVHPPVTAETPPPRRTPETLADDERSSPPESHPDKKRPGPFSRFFGRG